MSTDAAALQIVTLPTPTPPASAASDTSALPDDLAVCHQMIAELLKELRRTRRRAEDVEQRLDALLRRLHGPRPEPVNPNQPPLFPELLEAPPPPPVPSEDGAQPKKKARPHGRRQPPKELRHEPRRYELTGAERLCPACGSERRAIGAEVTSQYDYKPAEIFVIEHQRVKYACPCCAGEIGIAAKPAQPLERALPGPGLLALVAVDKHLDHIPLYRTEHRLARLGLPIARSTLSDWLAALAMLLTPLYQLLADLVRQSKVLHTDDTTVPVQDRTQTTVRYGRLWDYIGDAAHPGVVFDYTPTHARDGPTAFLKDFRGFLQADAYGVYDRIYADSHGAIIEVGCWAHVRHKFEDAQKTDAAFGLAGIAWIRKLYDVEEEATKAHLSSAERRRLRQEKSVPLLDSFHTWLAAQQVQTLPKSPNATALNYALNQWAALTRYTTDGDLHIDNNLSERTLKLIGIGRKNWLFLGNDQAGHTAAVLYSFTGTCKHLGIDAFRYLQDVLTRLPTHPLDRLEELLPHHWQATHLAAQAADPSLAGETQPTV